MAEESATVNRPVLAVNTISERLLANHVELNTVPNNINSKSMEEATNSYTALISRWPLGAYQVRSDCEEN